MGWKNLVELFQAQLLIQMSTVLLDTISIIEYCGMVQ